MGAPAEQQALQQERALTSLLASSRRKLTLQAHATQRGAPCSAACPKVVCLLLTLSRPQAASEGQAEPISTSAASVFSAESDALASAHGVVGREELTVELAIQHSALSDYYFFDPRLRPHFCLARKKAQKKTQPLANQGSSPVARFALVALTYPPSPPSARLPQLHRCTCAMGRDLRE